MLETPSPGPSRDDERYFHTFLERRRHGEDLDPQVYASSLPPDVRSGFLRILDDYEDLRRSLGASAPQLDIGRELGDYRLVKELGRGGMGIVYEAEQISLQRYVAVKVLPALLTLNARALARFHREAEITARLHHRGIVAIHQIGEAEGIHFIAMELVEGAPLSELIERMRSESFQDVRKTKIGDLVSPRRRDEVHPGPETNGPPATASSKKGSSSASNKSYIETAVKLVIQVADALEHAHRAGVIHRDVKPSNILVRGDGTAVLTDFGLAREEGLPSISATGEFAGTPHYVAPEQVMTRRMPMDQRVDVFSLGATLYELLTLQLAFPGRSAHEVLARILTKEPVTPHRLNPALASDLVTIVLKALEKDPDRRYASAGDMADDLRAFIEYRSIRARRTPMVVRAWRWGRREPLRAALVGGLVVALPLGLFAATRLTSLAQQVAASEVPVRLERGFTHLVLQQPAEAERCFEEVLGGRADTDDRRKAAAGLALVLLGDERAEEIVARFGADTSATNIPAPLLIEALRNTGRGAAAENLQGALKAPATPVDKYLEAVKLLYGRPVATGLSLRAPLYQRRGPTPAGVHLEEGEDTLLQYRARGERAIALLDEALLRAREDRPLYHFALCSAVWVARDADRARLVSDAVAEEYPDSAAAWFYVGLAREVFDPKGAFEALEEAVRIDPTLWPAVDRQAVLLLLRGDVEAAIDLLRDAVRQAPERATFHANLAEAYTQAGRVRDAEAASRKAIELDDRLVSAYDLLGGALFQLEQYGEACDAFRLAVQLEPTGARLRADFGWALRQAGDIEGATRQLERAYELDPEYPFAAFNLGVLRREAKRLKEAVDLHREAIASAEKGAFPSFPVGAALGSLGQCYLQIGATQEAIRVYRKALAADPDDPQHCAALGNLLGGTREYESAIAPLRIALDELPDMPLLYMRLAQAYGELGRYAEQLTTHVRWTEALPTDAAAWHERAWHQIRPGLPPDVWNAADALRSAHKAESLVRDNAAALYTVLRADGDHTLSPADVLHTLSRALEANGLHEEAMDTAYHGLELATQTGRSGSAAELSALLEELEALGD